MKTAIDSLFLGAYWKARQETRADCASRLANYIREIGAIEPTLQQWFQKSSRRQNARKAADLSIDGIVTLLKTNDREFSGDPMVELGFNLSLWNGGNASISATVGAFSPYIENSVVLSFRGACPTNKNTWRRLIEEAVKAFDPDSAVVTNHDYIAAHGDGTPDQAGGWFTYVRGSSVQERAFP
jgi:hypothetical protein